MTRVEPTNDISGGGGASSFVALDDTPVDYIGQALKLARVNAGATALEFGNSAALNLQRVIIVDPTGNGDETTVQAGIDAATTPSASNPWVVLVSGRHAVSAALTLRSFVDVRGFGRDSTQITFALAGPGDAITGIADCALSDMTLERTDSNSGELINDAGASNFTVERVRTNVTGTVINHGVTAIQGTYRDCAFNNTSITFGGSAGSPTPRFEECNWTANNGSLNARIQASSTLSTGKWSGGVVSNNGANVASWQVDSAGVTCVGALIESNTDVTAADTRAHMIGCRITHRQTSGTRVPTVVIDAGAKFTGCDIEDLFNNGSGTIPAGMIQVDSLGQLSSFGETLFNGCTFKSSGFPSAIFGLTSALTDTGMFTSRLTISNCILDAGANLNSVIGIVSAGFSGNVLVELNNNKYLGGLVRTTNPGSGQLIFSGSDLETALFPVLPGIGTGAAVLVGDHVVQELNADGETAYVTGRMPVPGVTRVGNTSGQVIQALLVVSGTWSRGSDTFTDPDTTNLTVHIPDSGSGWSAISGAYTIQGNTAQASAAAEYSWDDATKNGRIEATVTQSSAITVRNGGVFWRRADAQNFWRMEIRNSSSIDEMQIIKKVANVDTVVFTLDNAPTTAGQWQIVFQGDELRVYVFDALSNNLELQFRTTDSDLAGIAGAGLFNVVGTNTVDNWVFDRGDEVDLTVNLDHSQPYDALDHHESLALADVPATHLVQSWIDIFDALDNVRESELLGFEVVLDAKGASLSALNIHGILLQKLRGGVVVAENIGPTSGWPLVI